MKQWCSISCVVEGLLEGGGTSSSKAGDHAFDLFGSLQRGKVGTWAFQLGINATSV